MIVAISEGKILAHADLATECAEKMMSSTLAPGMVRYRPASPALQAAIESGASLDSLNVVFDDQQGTADLTEDDSIRTIRDHVLAKALENTK